MIPPENCQIGVKSRFSIKWAFKLTSVILVIVLLVWLMLLIDAFDLPAHFSTFLDKI